MKNPRIKTTEVIVGTGSLAEGDVWVKIHARFFLNRGEEIKGIWGSDESILTFRLLDREIIPGFRSAAEGMRVGGLRRAIIPPHLAFREEGIDGLIPPNAVLHMEIQLLDAGKLGEPTPLDHKHGRGRLMTIRAWDEESSKLPRWELVFCDANDPYYPSKGFLQLEWNTRNDCKWGRRSSRRERIELILTPDGITSIIDDVKQLITDYPSEFLPSTEIHTHGGYSPSRANSDSMICWPVSVYENLEYETIGYLRKESSIWTKTQWGRQLMEFVQPHLKEAPNTQKLSRRLPRHTCLHLT